MSQFSGPTLRNKVWPLENLSDKALAVFAFALYHQLTSGEPVSRVIRQDGSGHQADDDAVGELQERGFAETDGNWIVFTEAGLQALARLAEGLRRTH
jgi:hypothetical protein